MSDKLVTLLKQRYAIEQRIHQLKAATISESKRDSAQSMYIKLQNALKTVNEEIGNLEHTLTIEHGMDMEHGDSHQELDHEVEMARNELYNLAHHATKLHELLQSVGEQQGLEGWVQAKITKAADYIETVWHYLSYEMKHAGGHEDEMRVGEGVAAFGPGQDPNDPATGQQPQAPGAPQQQQQAAPGQSSPTPPAGGSTPGMTADGMVKMAKLGPDKKPQGTPIMVKPTDIATKQKGGYFVIGESASAGASSAGGMGASPTGFASGGIGMQKRKKKIGEGGGVVHCSQCGKGFSSSGLKPPHHTGFSHCKDHKGMTVVAEGTMSDAEKESDGPKFTGYWKGKDKGKPGKKMVGGGP